MGMFGSEPMSSVAIAVVPTSSAVVPSQLHKRCMPSGRLLQLSAQLPNQTEQA